MCTNCSSPFPGSTVQYRSHDFVTVIRNYIRHHSLKRFAAFTQVRTYLRERNTAHARSVFITTTTRIMVNGEYSEHASSLPTVDDLPADIRDLLENYSGVKPEDVIAHIVNVVRTVTLCWCCSWGSFACFVVLSTLLCVYRAGTGGNGGGVTQISKYVCVCA